MNESPRPNVGALRFVALVIIGTVLSGCSASEPVYIGLVSSVAMNGSGVVNGARLAVDEVNRAGGVRGRPLELVLRDDSGSGARALRIARELYDNPEVVAVVGHQTTFTMLVASPVYNEDPMPLSVITPTAGGTNFVATGGFSFQVAPTDREQGNVLAAWAREGGGAEAVSILFENTPAGRTIEAQFERQFVRLGGVVVASDIYAPEITGPGPLVRNALAQAPDLVLVIGSPAVAQELVRAVRGQASPTQVLVGGPIAVTGDPVELPEGVAVAVPAVPEATSREFTSNYQARFGGTRPTFQAMAAFDAVRLLAETLETVGFNRRTVRDGLLQVGGERDAFLGATGRIAFDAVGGVPGRSFTVGIVQSGGVDTGDGNA